MPEILIGTSGYDYPEWRGVFYPAELKRADFLPYYATQFNALELNSSFYNMPTAERLLSFWERSGGALKFSVKANRLLTQLNSQHNPLNRLSRHNPPLRLSTLRTKARTCLSNRISGLTWVA